MLIEPQSFIEIFRADENFLTEMKRKSTVGSLASLCIVQTRLHYFLRFTPVRLVACCFEVFDIDPADETHSAFAQCPKPCMILILKNYVMRPSVGKKYRIDVTTKWVNKKRRGLAPMPDFRPITQDSEDKNKRITTHTSNPNAQNTCTIVTLSF